LLLTIIGLLQVVVAIALIWIIAIQQAKNEGLGAAISARSSTSFKGKAGFDERLTDMTKKISIGFFVLSIIVAVMSNR
jgi:protein translocase SecG subunit